VKKCPVVNQNIGLLSEPPFDSARLGEKPECRIASTLLPTASMCSRPGIIRTLPSPPHDGFGILELFVPRPFGFEKWRSVENIEARVFICQHKIHIDIQFAEYGQGFGTALLIFFRMDQTAIVPSVKYDETILEMVEAATPLYVRATAFPPPGVLTLRNLPTGPNNIQKPMRDEQGLDVRMYNDKSNLPVLRAVLDEGLGRFNSCPVCSPIGAPMRSSRHW
jgi:hypothetical protein